jgi:dCTP deaminase
MVLSDDGIKKALASGDLEIDPIPREDQYQTSSVDIFLGDSFRIWDKAKLAVKGFAPVLNLAEQAFQDTANAFTIEAPRETDQSVILPPFAEDPCVLLCLTRERIHLKKGAALAARVEGRSSLARIGITVHLTAPIIHAGFDGPITLEIVNFGAFHVKFIPNETRICQFIIEKLDTAATGDLLTAFQRQETPIGRSAQSSRTRSASAKPKPR